MRIIGAPFLSLMLLLACFTAVRSASAQPTEAALEGGEIPCGETANFNFVINDATGLSSFGLTITYDRSVAEFVEVFPSQATSDWAAVTARENSPGVITLGGFRGSGTLLEGEQTIAIFTFDCEECNGLQTTPLFSNASDGLAGLTIVAAPITCAQEVTPSPTATPVPTPSPTATPSPTSSPTPGPVPAVTLDAPESIDCGQQFTVLINANLPEEIGAFGLEVTYNRDNLRFIRADNGLETGEWAQVNAQELSPGSLRVGGFRGSGDPISGSANLAILTFACEACGTESDFTAGNFTDGLTGAADAVVSIVCNAAPTPTATPSATPTASPTPSPSPTASPTPSPFSLTIDEVSTVCGEELVVPVTIGGMGAVSAFGFDLIFPAEDLEFLRLETGEPLSDWASTAANLTAPGKLRIGAFRGNGTEVQTPAEVMSLVFTCERCGVSGELLVSQLTDSLAGAMVTDGSFICEAAIDPPSQPVARPVLKVTITEPSEAQGAVSYVYTWSSNDGVEIEREPTDALSDELSETADSVTFEEGQRWEVEIKPFSEGIPGDPFIGSFRFGSDGEVIFEGWTIQ